MKDAIEFVKKFGWEKASSELSVFQSSLAMNFGWSFVDDLKRLIESHDIIKKYNINNENINWMLSKLNSNARHRIMQAWKDVESCK